jgi:hypothetical protein
MKIRISIPETGTGFGTKVEIDGQPIKGLTHLTLSVPAEGLAELTLQGVILDENERMHLERYPNQESRIAEYKTHVRATQIEIEGEGRSLETTGGWSYEFDKV